MTSSGSLRPRSAVAATPAVDPRHIHGSGPVTRAPQRSVPPCIAHALFATCLLLAAPPWAAPRAAELPDPPLTPADAVERLAALAGDRLALFAEASADDLALDWQGALATHRAFDTQLRGLQKPWREARQRFAVVEGLARGAVGEQAMNLQSQVAAAQQHLLGIQAHIAALDQEHKAFRRLILDPIAARVDRFNTQWLALYRRMRSLVPRDSTDPGSGLIADALVAIAGEQPSFFEGHVLAALAALHADHDIDDVRMLLDDARRTAPVWVDIPTSPICVDFCYACCLAGVPRRADEIIKNLKSRGAESTSVEQDWVIGVHAWSSDRTSDARKYMAAAMRKSLKQRQALGTAVHPVIVADAVSVALLLGSGNQGDRAMGVLDDEDVRSSGTWQVLRARALLLADDGRLDEAAKLAAICRNRAPAAQAGDLGRQFTRIHGN